MKSITKHFIISVAILFTALLLDNCTAHKNITTENQPIPHPEKETSMESTLPQETSEGNGPPSFEEKDSREKEHHKQTEPEKEEGRSPEEIMEDAMNAYQEALLAWDQGELEAAIIALDESYNLILKINLSQDSPLIQDKNNLRILIAQRIQEIYASRISAIGENHQSIPLVENEHVQAEIKRFQTIERESFMNAYKLSGRYRQMILTELKKERLPEELSWMPVIESWFKVRALSRARALGLWQFIASTGYRFGLKRDRWIDERMDPEKSTRAAIKYLKELHNMFGDWTTALASYNCGEFRVQGVIKTQRINYLDNFWDLYIMLPRETARFVPRFIATLLIINNPDKYGMTLPEPDSPLAYETVSINRPVMLSQLSKNIAFEEQELTSLNPELRHNSTPEYEYLLKVPKGFRQRTLAAINTLPRWIPPEATYTLHYVRRGETVSGIASRHRTSVSAIARLNRLNRKYLIRPGQRLKIPTRSTGSYTASRSPNLAKEGDKLVYTVKRGDSLYLIASTFKTSIQNIKNLNGLSSNILRIGQKLVIHSGTPEGAVFYTVKTGDSPYKIAQKFKMKLDVLLNLNGLASSSKIYPGQKLWVKEQN